MLPKAHLISHSRMSFSSWVWVTTPSWSSGSWRSFLHSSSVYSCHLLLVSSAFVRSIPFLTHKSIYPEFKINLSDAYKLHIPQIFQVKQLKLELSPQSHTQTVFLPVFPGLVDTTTIYPVAPSYLVITDLFLLSHPILLTYLKIPSIILLYYFLTNVNIYQNSTYMIAKQLVQSLWWKQVISPSALL